MIPQREILKAVAQDKRLTAAERELLRELVLMRDANGVVTPDANQLTEFFNLSRTALYNRIQKAEQHGYLREVGRDGRQRIYEMTLPGASRGDVGDIESRLGKIEQELAEARAIGERVRRLEQLVREKCGEA